MPTAPLRTAVIGVGHFGRFHAEKYAKSRASTLVAVVDEDGGRAADTARRFGADALTDYRALFGKVDAVSVAVPTAAHFEVAGACLENGIHVLVEKPIAETLEQVKQGGQSIEFLIARRDDKHTGQGKVFITPVTSTTNPGRSSLALPRP